MKPSKTIVSSKRISKLS